MKSFMRNMISVLAILVLICGIGANLHSDVYGASASLTGTTTVRAGDTITLTLVVSDNGKYALEGTFSYDSSKVTLTGVSSARTGWAAELSGNTLIAYDDAMTNPLSGSANVIKATFKVNSSVAVGTTVTISVKDLVTTTGSSESNIGTATYSVSIAKPLSTDNTLSALSVDGYTLSPAFSSGTTSYSIGEVDYSVSSLNVKATRADSNATVTISGNNLAVGANTVTITVKAENGSTKTYKISVTRKQNPNYVASNNANLSSITVTTGKLSPAFNANVGSYVVYLPYEDVGTKFVVSGKAQDSKATGVTSGTIQALAEGSNTTSVICTAEDGTKKTYTVTVVVMPKYEGGTPTVNEPEVPTVSEDATGAGEEATDSDVDESKDTDEDSEQTQKTVSSNQGNKTPAWLIIIFVLLAAVAGFGACYILFSKKML